MTYTDWTYQKLYIAEAMRYKGASFESAAKSAFAYHAWANIIDLVAQGWITEIDGRIQFTRLGQQLYTVLRSNPNERN